MGEKGGIALCGGLDYFVPHGEKVGTVLARCGVWLNDNAPQLVVNVGESGSVGGVRAVVHQMGYRVVKSIPRKVARYAYYVAHVVAFQFKHQLKVVAQIVVRFAESQGQLSLQQATGHTSCQPHLSLVPQPYPVERSLQGQHAVAVDAYKTAFGKMMPLFHHLQGESTSLRHLQLEISRCVGLQCRVGQAHNVAVEHQVGIPDGDGAVLIQHTSRESHCRDVFEVDVRNQASVQRQVYRCRTRCGVVVLECGMLRGGSDDIFLIAAIRQAVELVESAVVRHHGLHYSAVAARGHHCDVGAGRAVLVMHPSAHSSPGGACADSLTAVACGDTLAGIAHRYAVLPLRAHRRVGRLVPPVVVGGGAQFSPVLSTVCPGFHKVVVHPSFGGRPRQQHMVGIFLVGGCEGVEAGSIGEVGRHVTAQVNNSWYSVVDAIGEHWQRHASGVVIVPVFVVYAGCVQYIHHM